MRYMNMTAEEKAAVQAEILKRAENGLSPGEAHEIIVEFNMAPSTLRRLLKNNGAALAKGRPRVKIAEIERRFGHPLPKILGAMVKRDMTAAEARRRLNISHSYLNTLLEKYELPRLRAATGPGSRGVRGALITIGERSMRADQWAAELGVKVKTLRYRLKHWTHEQILRGSKK